MKEYSVSTRLGVNFSGIVYANNEAEANKKAERVLQDIIIRLEDYEIGYGYLHSANNFNSIHLDEQDDNVEMDKGDIVNEYGSIVFGGA